MEKRATEVLNDGHWHHVRVIRLSATEQRVYIDHIEVPSDSLRGILGSVEEPPK